MSNMSSPVDDLLAAPIGVALLDRLEAAHRRALRHPFDALDDSDPEAVAQAIAGVTSLPRGRLLRLVLEAAHLGGPWTARAPEALALAYRQASAREELATSLWRRFGDGLAGPPDLEAQEHWDSEALAERRIEPAFTDYARVYGNGEFTWAGLWTIGAPPSELHDELPFGWDFDGSPISRWRLPVDPGARVWNIDRPEDWVALVERFPRLATVRHAGWELPGPNQRRGDVDRLASLERQHGVRRTIGRHVLPDWTAVAAELDGVHLSWAGFITTEGFVSDLGRGGVTMLRYWASERTLWLRDVFGEPVPLGPPRPLGSHPGRSPDRPGGETGQLPATRSAALRALRRRLGRAG